MKLPQAAVGRLEVHVAQWFARGYQVVMDAVRSLALFVTESCNLACPYCFAANMEGRHIDPKVARAAMDALLFHEDNKAKTVSITWWGGEPLAAYDILHDLILYAEKRASETRRTVRFGMPTNLTLLTESMLDFLTEHEVGLSLSLDGDDRAQQIRRLRGGGSSFPLVIEKLELLRAKLGNRMPGVRMTVGPDTVCDLFHNVKFFLDREMKHINFAAILEADWTDEQSATYESEQRRLVDHWVSALRSGSPWHSTIWNKALARRHMKRKAIYDGKPGVFCGAGTSSLAVDIYGDIFPCHRYAFYDKSERGQAMGNIADFSDGSYQPPRSELKLDNLRVAQPNSGQCGSLEVCEQLCPAVNFAVTGDPCVIPATVARLAQVDERVLDYLENEVEDDPKYQHYLENVILRAYKWGELSATTVMLLSRIDRADTDELASRAGAILDRLQRSRKAPAAPED